MPPGTRARALAQHILDDARGAGAGRRRRRRRIVEFGGGNGTLALSVLDALRAAGPDEYSATRYQLIEVLLLAPEKNCRKPSPPRPRRPSPHPKPLEEGHGG